MTSTDPIPTITSLVHDGVTMSEMTGPQVATLIQRLSGHASTRDFIVKARGGEGVNVLGLYVEAVVYDASGAPHSHLKYFIVNRSLFAYSRSAGDSRANWRQRDFPDTATSLRHVQNIIDRENVMLIGHPVLVELTSDDLSSMETGNMPPARFRGQTRIERGYGKYDFTGSITAKPLPARVKQVLHTPINAASAGWRTAPTS
jgi:hypothetical protein